MAKSLLLFSPLTNISTNPSITSESCNDEKTSVLNVSDSKTWLIILVVVVLPSVPAIPTIGKLISLFNISPISDVLIS